MYGVSPGSVKIQLGYMTLYYMYSMCAFKGDSGGALYLKNLKRRIQVSVHYITYTSTFKYYVSFISMVLVVSR